MITHQAPSFLSVEPKWQSSEINHFFAIHLDDIVEAIGAKLWVHGHMHSGFDYPIGDTRVVCNPKGYPGEKQTTPFIPKFIVEV